MLHTQGRVTRGQLVTMRRTVQRAVQDALPKSIRGAPRHAMGSSGTIRAVCSFAAAPGTAHATREALTRAVEELVRLGPEGRRKRFDAQRAEIIIAGAVILESIAHALKVDSITAVDGGLKEGLLVDLVRRARARREDPVLSDAVFVAGRRFGFDEAHARHTRDVALALYDQLASTHHLPTEARLILEVAAVLHDVGYAVSAQRHHKHSHYLIDNMDLPGLSDRERRLAALVARFHRRSPPNRDHPSLQNLAPVEQKVVRAASALMRIADGCDRNRSQPVDKVQVAVRERSVVIRLRHPRGKTIEPWDHETEAALFRTLFGRRLEVEIVHGRTA